MKYNIPNNDQRNNLNFNGDFPAWKQCFSTSAWMFMSHYSEDIDVKDDLALSKYVDDVEATVGQSGIAEKVKEKMSWITGRTSYWGDVQAAGITQWLNERGVSGKAIFSYKKILFENLRHLIDLGPVILCTNKLGGLPDGHVILAIGYDAYGIICNDPFGNANTDYGAHDGEHVLYSDTILRPACGDKIICIFWKA